MSSRPLVASSMIGHITFGVNPNKLELFDRVSPIS